MPYAFSGERYLPGPRLLGHEDAILSMAISVDGKVLASGGPSYNSLGWPSLTVVSRSGQTLTDSLSRHGSSETLAYMPGHTAQNT
jgi:hypothetical protein